MYKRDHLPGGHVIMLSSEHPTALSCAPCVPSYAVDGYLCTHDWLATASAEDDASTAAALSALRAFPDGLHVGGGITPETASQFLDAGASHVIVTSYIFRDGSRTPFGSSLPLPPTAPTRLTEPRLPTPS